jgi:hypothetical protein
MGRYSCAPVSSGEGDAGRVARHGLSGNRAEAAFTVIMSLPYDL